MSVVFIPETGTLITYSIACFVLFVTPGPDMSLFLSQTISGGRRAGIASIIGAAVGCLIHTILATVGLSALIAASPVAFTLIKIIGALYLGWLAIGAIRNGSALNIESQTRSDTSLARTFWLGVMINLSNPKVVLFFVTFLPQFVSVDDPNVAGKLAFLGLYFVVFTIPLAALMILGAEQVIENLKQNPRIMRAVDYIFAGVFGVFAIKILTTENR
jgi:threonine/homoserine/homoserine lactone efflux protein